VHSEPAGNVCVSGFCYGVFMDEPACPGCHMLRTCEHEEKVSASINALPEENIVSFFEAQLRVGF